ncbi:hypothetical protein GCM10017653_00090 [Ancylobacter defluvii]|uniref:Uncharacterized protein n=1 Tax=Ancylobacter defluvii TaxID=1282440 RepID=A0A9W6N8W0_9HYPH|nr:hypothetical protein GCM10017653_00090 [Ancylobacter defluvii]
MEFVSHTRRRGGTPARAERLRHAEKRKGRVPEERPKSREETPKEGDGNATPITLPHRNNMQEIGV